MRSMEYKDEMKNMCFLPPAFGRDVAIVLISSKKKLYDTAATIASIVDNSVETETYDILVLHDNLDYYDEDALMHINTRKNISIRLNKIEHSYNRGYVHIDKRFPHDLVTEAYLPFLVKRFNKMILVRPGFVVRSDISDLYGGAPETTGYKRYGNDKESFITVYNTNEFRIMYSSRAIADALNSFNNNTDSYYMALNPGIPKEGAETLGVYGDEELNNKLLYRTPFFEAKLYEIGEEKNSQQVICEKKWSGVYLFPFENVPKGGNVAIYGNGNVGHQFIDQIKKTNYCNLVAVCDRNKRDGIVSIDELKSINADKIIIAIASEAICDEVMEELRKQGIDTDKVVCGSHRELFI